MQVKSLTFNPFQENTYIIYDKTKQCIIIDPGCYENSEKTELVNFIESNNLNTSVGWRNKNERIWNIYAKNEIIRPNGDFEILLFRPGYEILIKAIEK